MVTRATIDFGHIHARGQGSLNTVEDFERIINMLENSLGTRKLGSFTATSAELNLQKAERKNTGTLMTRSLVLSLNIWPR